MVDLRGAVVVITGASSGIGQAAAEAFARRGARLVLAARSRRHLVEVARRCRWLGGDAIAVPTDVTIPSSVNDLVDHARAYGGGIDIWFSNVGSGSIGRFDETPIAVHEQVIRTNLISHMNDAHAVIPLFRRQGHGIFINMISLGAFAPTPYAASYSASKFGLRGFSEALRGEVSDQPDIHICDVYPTFVDAPGMPHAANYTGRRISVPPLAGDPRKIAESIVSLAVRPRDTTVLGATSHLARFGHLLAPNFSARMMARITRAYLARAPAAPITNGALFGPPARHAGIYSEGHDDDRHSASSATMLAIGLGLVGGAVALAMVSRRRGDNRE